MYIVIPQEYASDWSDILDYAYNQYDVHGNQFINSRQYNSRTGRIVFKLEP